MPGSGQPDSPEHRMTEAQWQVVRHLLIDFWHDIRKTAAGKRLRREAQNSGSTIYVRSILDAEVLWREIRTERQCLKLDRLVEAA